MDSGCQIVEETFGVEVLAFSRLVVFVFLFCLRFSRELFVWFAALQGFKSRALGLLGKGSPTELLK